MISGKFVWSIVLDKPVKFHDRRLTRSQEIPPEATWGGVLDHFLNFDDCQSEVASDVISGVVVDLSSMDVHVKFGGSRSDHSRDIWLPQFVTEELHRPAQVIT